MSVEPMTRPQQICQCCNRVVLCECKQHQQPEVEVKVTMTELQRETLKTLSRKALTTGGESFCVQFSWREKSVLEGLLGTLNAAPVRFKR